MLIYIVFGLVSSGFKVPETYTQEHIDRFAKGMKEYAPDLEIVPCSRDQCVITRLNIKKRRKIVILPFSEVISELDPPPPPFKSSHPKLNLYINLLYRKFSDKSISFVNSAIHLFPTSFDVPLNWTKSDFQDYHNISLWKLEIETAKDYQIFHYEFLKHNVQHQKKYPEMFEVESWKWAKMIIQTRSFNIELSSFHSLGYHLNVADDPSSSKRYDSIMPIIDWFNHDCKREGDSPGYMTEFNADPPTVSYRTLRSFQNNSEVLSFYGEKRNHMLLQYYGFVLKDNTHDSFDAYPLTFKRCTGLLYKEKCIFELGKQGLNKDFFLIVLKQQINATVKVRKILDQYFDEKIQLKEMSSMDLSVLISGHIFYRKRISELYAEADSMSLRDLRRNYLNKKATEKKSIVEFAESERLLYYEHLKLIDKSSLQITYFLLFE